MEKEKSTFNYTYSSAQQDEIRRIRSRYAPQPEDKMEQLRRLDRQAGSKAARAAVTLGIVGALVLGFGMSLIMTELYAQLGLPHQTAIAVGVCAGIIGIAAVCCSYPLYRHILGRERKRLAPRIISLTDELLK